MIVDDIISSGRTMLRAIELAEQCGCGRVVVAAVHAVQQPGIDMLRKRAWRVIASDTIDTPVSGVSVIEKVAEAVKGAGGAGEVSESIETRVESVASAKEQEQTGLDENALAGAFSMFD